MAARLRYERLARYLKALPDDATNEDLAKWVYDFKGTDVAYRAELMIAVLEQPLSGQWIDGLLAICDKLEEDSPRFQPFLFLYWVTGDRWEIASAVF